MEGKKALLKIKETFHYLEQRSCYTVIEATEGLFYFHQRKGHVELLPEVEIEENQLKFVRSENGAPVEIEAYNILGEPMDLFLGDEEDMREGEKETLMVFNEISRNQYSLRTINGKGETVRLSLADLGETLEGTLETLRDCDGIVSADFMGEYFVIEIDPRTSLMMLLRDIEKWLRGEFLNVSVLTIEDYLGRFSHCPSFLLPPPNQLWLPGIRE